MQVLAMGGRYGAYASNRTMLHRLISPPCVPPYAQVRQTMMLATQKEPPDGTWLLRCVASAICTLMCAVCVGSVAVISTVCVIVGARLLHMRTGPVGRRGRRAPACPGAI